MAIAKTNIFRFATKELAQDAFLCWCFSWINQTENLAMRKFSIDLLTKMLNFHNIHLDVERMEKFEVKRQHKNIDVLVCFNIGNQPYRIIIEDKTNTAMHSNQLVNYFNAIKKEPSDVQPEIIGIYFKTGYIFDNEVKYIEDFNKNHGRFQIFRRQDMIGIMEKHRGSVTSDFFQDYYEYICDLQSKEDNTLQNLCSPDLDVFSKSLHSQIGQWLYMKQLFDGVQGDLSIKRGNSKGQPWTQCSFLRSNTNIQFPEALFYRLDRRAERVYLSLRQYYDYENTKTIEFLNKPLKVIREEKVERLNKLIDIFNQTMNELDNLDYKLETGKRVTDKAGKKESEIGVFFLKGDNTPEKIKRFIPVFHRLFIQKLSENDKWGLSSLI